MEQQPAQIGIPVTQIQEVLRDKAIPKYYVNGFVTGRSQSDMFIMPTTNGNPTLVMNLSFNSAKMLKDLLDKALKDIETQLGHEIKSLPFTPPTNK